MLAFAVTILLGLITGLLINFLTKLGGKEESRRIFKGWKTTIDKRGFTSWVSEPFYVNDCFRGEFEWLTINLHSIAYFWVYEVEEEYPHLIKRDAFVSPPPAYIEKEGVWYGDTFGVPSPHPNKMEGLYIVRVAIPEGVKIQWKVTVEQAVYKEVSW